MKKRILMLPAMLLFITVIMNNDIAAEKKQKISDHQAYVIEAELIKVMEKADERERIIVDIWFTGVDSDAIEEKVKEKVGINRESIRALAEAGRDLELSSEIVDQYIETERKLYAEEQLRLHKQFFSTYKNLVNLSGAQKDENAFISKYSPLISVSLNKTEIAAIAKDERVYSIAQTTEWEYSDSMDTSVPLIRANHTRDALGYDGSGIRIGQIELEMPDRNSIYFRGASITYDPNVNMANNDTHANIVANVIISQTSGTSYGIAPRAQLYATRMISGYDWRPRIEWLLDQGVHVINMSATTNRTQNGQYEAGAQWVDHIAVNHSVHFVHAGGNKAWDDYIEAPGMAYNAITVGAINDKGTATESDDELCYFSSTEDFANAANKPDIVAPGENIATLAGTDSGTSFAAPQVTGVIAQLLQQRPALKVLQDGLKAILTASVNHSILSYRTLDSEFDKSGAGLIDAQSSSWTVSNSRYLTSDFAANSANGSERIYTFYVSSSDDMVRVSLAFLKYNNCSGNHLGIPSVTGRLADLDLFVYDPNGSLVGSAGSPRNNLEIIKFVPHMTGTYTIKVRQFSNSDQRVYYGLAWW